MSAPSPVDPLAAWTVDATARDGSALRIRPLRADDRSREVAFINSLSHQTRYMRLLAPLRFLTPHLLDQLMDVDGEKRVAFVAAVEQGGAEEFVGIARYGATDEPGVVELGVTVTDAWQRRGVAQLLVEQLIRFAAWRGFKRMCGFVLPENTNMLALARKLGFTARFDSRERLTVITREL